MKRKNNEVATPSMVEWVVLLLTVIALVVVGLGALARVLDNQNPGSTDSETSAVCPDDAVEISIDYMPLSDGYRYMPQVIDQFNAAYAAGTNPITGQPLGQDEKRICVTGKEGSSGTVMQGIVNAVIAPNNANVERPTIFQPAVSHWLTLANELSRQELFQTNDIYPIALSPVVLAIWESRLEAIRRTVGHEDVGWEELLAVLHSPNGWCDYGIPNCRRTVYYGHTDPYISSTGLSTLISEFYASARQRGFAERTLTLAQVNDPTVQQGVRDIESLIRHYSRRTTEFKFYIAQGPEYLDFVALPENDLIYINREESPPEKLVALYPKEGTFWHEHPFGIVEADWTTPEQREAARVFTQYALTPEIQRLIMSKNFRPANPDVALEYPIVEELGVAPEGPATVLDVPPAEVVAAIQQSWSYVKKQADVMLLVDTSGSMGNILGIGESKIDQAKQAAEVFLDNMEQGNRVGLATFSDGVQVTIPLGDLESNRGILQQGIRNLGATGGTAMYDAINDVVGRMNQTDSDSRIRAVVLLSDGGDTTSMKTLNDAVQIIQASGDSLNPVIVIPVAYGGDADIAALNSIARASATNVQSGDPQNILGVLDIISSYF